MLLPSFTGFLVWSASRKLVGRRRRQASPSANIKYKCRGNKTAPSQRLKRKKTQEEINVSCGASFAAFACRLAGPRIDGPGRSSSVSAPSRKASRKEESRRIRKEKLSLSLSLFILISVDVFFFNDRSHWRIALQRSAHPFRGLSVAKPGASKKKALNSGKTR